MSDPERLTLRLETFCQAAARGMTMTAAGIEAGWSPATAHAAGYRASRRPDVIGRIAEIRDQLSLHRDAAMAMVAMPTRAEILRQLLEVAETAKRGQQLQSQLRAIELIGKELGMFVQRTQVEVINPLTTLSPLALRQLSAILEGEAVEVEPPLLLEGEGEAEPAD